MNKFSVGDLVTFKTHPLLNDFYIKGDGKYVPPIMIVKEVVFENKEKKQFDEQTGYQVSDAIKYICVYFDDNKSEFIESHLYESNLESFSNLKIAKFDDEELPEGYTDVITEVTNYPKKIDYNYGIVLYFKTKKLEVLKKRESTKTEVVEDPASTNDEIIKKKTRQYVVNYITPDFVACGFKKEVYNDLFYGNGKVKRLASTDLIKVKWFNPAQQKFSEQFLPIEFFLDFDPFNSQVTINKYSQVYSN
nr:hypothetical protein [uncultured Flavobacterium sp.]